MSIEENTPRAYVEGEEKCRELLFSRGLPDKVAAHCLKTADTAYSLAEALNKKGFDIDTALCVRAALLHDIERTQKRHALVGAEYLRALGMEAEADIVECHMGPGVDFDALTEREVVFLADKLTKRDRRVSIAERYELRLLELRDIPEAAARVEALRDDSLRLAARAEAILGFPLIEL